MQLTRASTKGRPFAVFDIDGTVIRWQLYHAIVDELVKQDSISPTVHEVIQQARMTWKKRSDKESFLEYEHVLIEQYLSVLPHITVAQFEAVVETVFQTYKDQVYIYTRNLLRKLKSEGYLLFAISGSQQQIVTKLGRYYGFDAVIGSEYEVINGHFTGNATLPALIGKGTLLKQLVQTSGAKWEGSIGVGDTPGDISMLELVEHPIAFNPSQELFALAQKKGWNIVVERKNMVYELRRDENGIYRLDG